MKNSLSHKYEGLFCTPRQQKSLATESLHPYTVQHYLLDSIYSALQNAELMEVNTVMCISIMYTLLGRCAPSCNQTGVTMKPTKKNNIMEHIDNTQSMRERERERVYFRVAIYELSRFQTPSQTPGYSSYILISPYQSWLDAQCTI